MSSTVSPWKRVLASLRSQWVATTLIFPMIFLGVTTYNANEAAKEARMQSARVDRITRLQESGKTLDLALAAYFQSVAEVGLAQRHVKMPGAYDVVPVQKAEKTVTESRETVRQALVKHASDVQALRGTINEAESVHYMTALAQMTSTVDQTPDVEKMGASITVLSKLVVARNKLVDEAMSKVG